jgi:hypothetical protein
VLCSVCHNALDLIDVVNLIHVVRRRKTWKSACSARDVLRLSLTIVTMRIGVDVALLHRALAVKRALWHVHTSVQAATSKGIHVTVDESR